MRASLCVVLLAAASGCHYGAYFIRDTPEPVAALEVRMDPTARRDCLVVFLPGMLDTPDTYREHGFLHDAARASDRCDLVAVDAHFGYYQGGAVRQRVAEDVLRVAEGRGYAEIWIVGISMGGLGTLMVTQQQPERIRGVVLLAPFLGDETALHPIVDAGGLAAWDAPDDADPWREAEVYVALWAWLQGYATQPDRMPELHLGVGTEDSLRPAVDLLGEVLPEGRYATAPGGHGWTTWRVLWRRLLLSPPWDPSEARLADRGSPRR